MKLALATCVMAVCLAGCQASNEAAGTNGRNADVVDSVRHSLDQAQLEDVSTNQDRDKGVVTLSGSVPTEADKQRAETIAKTAAPGQIIANEIKVLPAGMESEAKSTIADIDNGIESNASAALRNAGLHDDVSVDATAGVVTLTGDVATDAARRQAEKTVAGVPNVKQVINKIEIEPRGR
ncbi:MAG: BON domain-containing protein [Acidobacteria bacterium]|nr:BON domain-containing protein [Acidobacteriota bacterium]